MRKILLKGNDLVSDGVADAYSHAPEYRAGLALYYETLTITVA